MSSKKVFKYDGADRTVTWDGRLCIHVGECGRAKGDLFVTGRKPWCSPDMASEKDTVEIIQRCPTGALALCNTDGKTIDEPTLGENTIHVSNDGPLYAVGDLRIDGATDDMPSVSHRAALCRCGASKNKPFCDNSHRDAGFHDAGAIGEKGVAHNERGGELVIKRVPDGPLEAEGNLSIYAGSGRSAWRGRKVYLCRCGRSNNKPFCDGSHKDAGFKAE